MLYLWAIGLAVIGAIAFALDLAFAGRVLIGFAAIIFFLALTRQLMRYLRRRDEKEGIPPP